MKMTFKKVKIWILVKLSPSKMPSENNYNENTKCHAADLAHMWCNSNDKMWTQAATRDQVNMNSPSERIMVHVTVHPKKINIWVNSLGTCRTFHKTQKVQFIKYYYVMPVFSCNVMTD